MDFADQDGQGGTSRVFRIAHFKALDWYIVAAVPRDEMEGPARLLLRRMVAFALGSAVLSVLGMLLVTARLIKPLRTLTDQAKALAGIDLTQAVVAPGAADSPLLALARAARGAARRGRNPGLGFWGHGARLDENIRVLMATTTAKQRMKAN